MPELPEVETVRNELTPFVIGRRITGVTLVWEGIVKQPSPEEFIERLVGQEITGLYRRGKYLYCQGMSCEDFHCPRVQRRLGAYFLCLRTGV